MNEHQTPDRIEHEHGQPGSPTNPYGFLTFADVARLASHPDRRLTLLLVRCGGCRFLAAAQDVKHITDALVSAGDYVRDISYPADAHGRTWPAGRY